MALSTYDDLVDAIIRWSHRKDILDLIPDFIALAEQEMFGNNGAQLTVRELETTSTAVISGQRLAVPDGFEKSRAFFINIGGNDVELKYQAPTQLLRQSSNGQPRFFTVIGSEFEFDRVPDSNYTVEIQYYKKPTPITPVNQTNVVMTNHHNIYLYGVLKQVFLWSMDDDQAVKYDSLFQDAIKGANKADKKGRYGPAPSMRVEGATP